jgi:hypothetical protein
MNKMLEMPKGLIAILIAEIIIVTLIKIYVR